jgi:hypothetical protein
VSFVLVVFPRRCNAIWAGVASIAAPNVVGLFMSHADLGAFLMFAGVGLIGAAAVAFLGIETRGRLLEAVFPEILACLSI